MLRATGSKKRSHTRLYHVLSGDPGIYCEIYLAKRAAYQDALHEALTAGVDLRKVRRYLRTHRRSGELKRFFAHYSKRDIWTYPIKDFDPMYCGYSMYEVDGVFFRRTPRKSTPHSTYEERTQVVRVIFRFDALRYTKRFHLDEQDIKRIARIYFRNQSSQVDVVTWHYEQQHKQGERMTANEAAFLRYLSKWHDQVILFACGFLVHRIAARLSELERARRIDSAEAEIWVSQFWNLNVNRVIGKRARQT